MSETTITNEKALEDYIIFLRARLNKEGVLKVSCKSGRTRTLTQNAAIHKYCTMLAEQFNEAGLDMQTVLAEGSSIPWSPEKVKDDIWRKVQNALLGKASTTKLNTNEVSQIYDVVNRHISNTFGIFVPFPSKDH